jgi:hypothetical protein
MAAMRASAAMTMMVLIIKNHRGCGRQVARKPRRNFPAAKQPKAHVAPVLTDFQDGIALAPPVVVEQINN